jgi:hypothetical protein
MINGWLNVQLAFDDAGAFAEKLTQSRRSLGAFEHVQDIANPQTWWARK